MELDLDHVSPFGRPTGVKPIARRDNWRKCEARTWKTASIHAPHSLFVRTARHSPAIPAAKGPVALRLDQFYTLDHVAAWCLQLFARHFDPAMFLMVEPSAGGGAFLKVMPDGTLAFDLEPMHPGILKAEYLTFEIKSDRPIATVGNPPFGRNANLAIKFFNHAARQSSVIAMILPRSFLKARIENALDPAFHLVHQEVVEPDTHVGVDSRATALEIDIPLMYTVVGPTIPTD
ncbi:MAG: hypothetical protein ABI240_04310 [Sphingomonas sp.]